MEQHTGTPYWIVKNPFYDYNNPLKKDTATDVAIIGAGLTGVLIAYELSRLGIPCILIDKRSIGTGSTTSGPSLLHYETDLPLCRLIDHIGEKAAVGAYQATLRSIADLENIFRHTRIHPDFERHPSISYATDAASLALLHTEHQTRKKHHLPTEILTAGELYRTCRFQAAGALIHQEAAQIDTYKATIGLLKYLMREHHTPVYTHTNIKRWQTTPRGCELMTDKGYIIESDYIIIATSTEARPFLPRPVTQTMTTYALVSHPVDTRWLWPRRSIIHETTAPHLHIRTTSRNRILVSTTEPSPDARHPRRTIPPGKIRQLEKKFLHLFPHFTFTAEIAWSAPAVTTPDGLPYIGTWPGHDRMYFALGYGQSSITHSLIAAQLIGKSLRNQTDPRAPIFGFGRRTGLCRAV